MTRSALQAAAGEFTGSACDVARDSEASNGRVSKLGSAPGAMRCFNLDHDDLIRFPTEHHATLDRIVKIRTDLAAEGLDAGIDTITSETPRVRSWIVGKTGTDPN